MQRLRLILLLALLLGLMAPTSQALAAPLVCTPGTPCGIEPRSGWRAQGHSGAVTPGDGGLLEDPETGFGLSFPPGAVSSEVTVVFESGQEPSLPVGPNEIALGYFSLQATETSGIPLSQFSLPWALRVDYRDCADPGDGLCALALVDEASLHCERYDSAANVWNEIDSSADVFSNRVFCAADLVGLFAIVAEPLDTSGRVDYTNTFLPLVAR